MANEDKIYLPKQKVTRGVPGYRGKNIVVVGDDGREDKKASAAAVKDADAAKADAGDASEK